MSLRSCITFVRSAGVGITATATDLGLLALLVSGLGAPVRVASVLALSFGVAVQFVGNKLFAFSDRSPRWFAQGAQFLGVEAIAFSLNLGLYDLAVTHTGLPYLPLRLATTSLVYFLVCYPLWCKVFKLPSAPSAAP
jgi:putative flippase GtrA